MENVQGHALVASPYLTDPNFLRSVVYIIRHDPEGAIGLVLNRPTQTNVGELLEQLIEQPLENEAPVYCGGPVDGPLMMLLKIQSDESQQFGIHVASDQQKILEVCREDGDCCPADYRVFDGYSGWGAQQLDDELSSGGWLVWDIQPDQVFSDPDELWQLVIRQIGREILSGGIDPSKIPEDPAYN